ncbi:hypothetical protein BDR04DRAFT_1026663, partial [Suillus decipiens]
SCNFLVSMATSVSSECTFSQGGITISKHCNHLKCDIVEVLQCVKCVIHHDLLFCPPGPSSSTKLEVDEFHVELDANDSMMSEGDDKDGWDVLLLEDDEDDIDII